jgi:hypothetical protein
MLSYASLRIEVTVPAGTPVRTRRTSPVDLAEGWVATVHYARSERLKEHILATGMEYPSYADDAVPVERYGTDVTFTLDALRAACRRVGRPVDPSSLLI